MKERLNWWVAIPVTAVGGGAVIAALYMEKWSDQAVSSMLLEFGAALGLVVALVLIEPRVTRRVTEAAAKVAVEAVQEESAKLRDRVLKLEDLGDAQRLKREERRAEASSGIDDLLSGPLSAETTGQLLYEAFAAGLLDERFHVRTGAAPTSPVLFVQPVAFDGTKPAGVWLSTREFDRVDLGEYENAPSQLELNSSTVEWVDPKTADTAASEIEAVLERENTAVDDFDLATALQNLASSVKTMREARAAPAGSGRRLEGQLAVLINHSWAITTAGLESTRSDIVFPITRAGFYLHGRTTFGRGYVDVGIEPAGDDWNEARRWLADRMNLEVRIGPQVDRDPYFSNVLAEATQALQEGHTSEKPTGDADAGLADARDPENPTP